MATVQIVTKKVEVREGGDVGYVEVTITAPPQFMCFHNDSDCIVSLATYVRPSIDDIVCPSTRARLPQVALAPYQADEECEQEFKAITWPKGVLVPVVATWDALEDGSAVREVELSVVVSRNSTVQFTEVVGTSEVDSPRLTDLHFLADVLSFIMIKMSNLVK